MHHALEHYSSIIVIVIIPLRLFFFYFLSRLHSLSILIKPSGLGALSILRLFAVLVIIIIIQSGSRYLWFTYKIIIICVFIGLVSRVWNLPRLALEVIINVVKSRVEPSLSLSFFYFGHLRWTYCLTQVLLTFKIDIFIHWGFWLLIKQNYTSLVFNFLIIWVILLSDKLGKFIATTSRNAKRHSWLCNIFNCLQMLVVIRLHWLNLLVHRLR